MTRCSRTFTNLLFGLPLATGLFSAASNASAQTSASFTVPFAFSADNQNVPAGSYSVQLQSDRFLYLRNLKTGKSQVLMVRPDDSGRLTDAPGRLVFQRYGTRAYLTEVWSSGTSMHSELVVRPKIERELAKGILQTGSSFEVALK